MLPGYIKKRSSVIGFFISADWQDPGTLRSAENNILIITEHGACVNIHHLFQGKPANSDTACLQIFRKYLSEMFWGFQITVFVLKHPKQKNA